MLIRELPPLRQSTIVDTPSGRRYRWAEDEHAAANVPFNDRCSDTMPGGFESKDTTLARDPAVDYSDLERLSTVTDYDAGGNIIWQGRLERAPRSSGDQIAISPGAVGWQAHLDDDQSASAIIISRGLDRWGDMSRARRVSYLSSPARVESPSVASDTDATPAIVQTLRLEGDVAPVCESLFDAGPGNKIASLLYEYALTNHGTGDADWTAFVWSADDDAGTVNYGDSGELAGATSGAGTYTPAAARRFIGLAWRYETNATSSPGVNREAHWTRPAAIGDHGLTLQDALGAGEEGFLASDIVRYAVERWAPRLTVTDESVTDSDFIIPELAIADPTSPSEFVRQATRFGLEDWAVWDDLVFWWHPRGARGRTWRARVGPAQLEETGPQVDRLWESVIVQYRDVDGSTRTVGPVGSGADTESDDLKDSDPENPANKLGITRRTKLDMGVGTARSATEVGRRFLVEQKQLDSSGRATLVGHVMDDRGVLHPYTRPRAGDTISFVDAADPSPRRIVRTEKTRATRSCTIDLDSPPESLAALLDRLGVVVAPLGV